MAGQLINQCIFSTNAEKQAMPINGLEYRPGFLKTTSLSVFLSQLG
jgi:hypothetical protein